jgi:3D (Asp-Asp-Asp) domain-containing protein
MISFERDDDMKRGKPLGRRRIRTILILLLLVWFVLEGRFYLPKIARPPRGVQPVEIELKTTSYCHCRKCCSYRWFMFIPYQKTGFMKYRLKHIGKTSSGAMVRPGTIAADTTRFPYGTVMHIPGYGYGRVEDTGGAVKGLHVDLYRPNHWFARKWGVQTKKVKVWFPPGWEQDRLSEPPVFETTPSTNQRPAGPACTNAAEEADGMHFTNELPYVGECPEDQA